MTVKSLGMDIEVAPDAKVLDGVYECYFAVIGSGIAGISTAYEFATRGKGKSVVVVDRGRICGGMPPAHPPISPRCATISSVK